MSKWINWPNVATAIFISGALAAFGWMGSQYWRVYAEHRECVKFVREHGAEEQDAKVFARQQAAVLEQIAKDVATIKRNSMTVIGDARITQGDGVFLMINSAGKANQYIGVQRCKVTNIRNPNALSVVVRITGQFRNEDEGFIALLSRKAADLLGAQHDLLKVRIEPVDGK